MTIACVNTCNAGFCDCQHKLLLILSKDGVSPAAQLPIQPLPEDLSRQVDLYLASSLSLMSKVQALSDAYLLQS